MFDARVVLIACLNVSLSVILYDMLAELEELDGSKAWPRLFQRLNWDASQKAGALTVARLPENRQLNRYRDVLPYDHSRITLKEGSPDYINANLVEVPRLNKHYILTQGPLPHTAKHFWQMIWEQNSAAVVMLNRVVEKNQIKCYQYWPCGEAYGHVNQLEFGNFIIYYIEELRNEYFTIRTLTLENVQTEERRSIYHFHYLTWPDFGVPTSPATFLAFLFEVRKAGVLSPDVGPCAIHCSAGIGRSGTFVMVDSVLKEIESTGEMDQISITDTLLEMRQYRLGLIQTPDQLRFTYLAILEGARVLMPEIYQRAMNRHLQTYAEITSDEESTEQNRTASVEQGDSGEETPPPLPPRRRLEAAAAADEPDTKRSRPSEHGTSQTMATTQKMDRYKNKSLMKSVFRLFKRKRKMKANSDVTEPEGEKDVFTDSSEGSSDEIINLSSLSDSEPEPEDESFEGNKGDLDNRLAGASNMPANEDIKVNEKENEPSVQSKLPQQAEEGEILLDQTDQTEKGNEGLQQTHQETHESFQQPHGGETKETDSTTEIRRRKREERKQKIASLVENIKKNVKREEDSKVWKSRLKKTLIAVAVCSVAYITFRYLTT